MIGRRGSRTEELSGGIRKCWPSLINFRKVNLFRLETNFKCSGMHFAFLVVHIFYVSLNVYIPCRHTSVNIQNLDTTIIIVHLYSQ